MPAVTFSPIFNGWQAFTPSGIPLTNGLVQTYVAGTTTPLPTYTTNIGDVANTNPIQLLSDGRPPQEIWLDAAFAYKFVLLDALLNPIGTYDNIRGIDNSAPPALSEWVISGLTPSYVNATTFTLAGNQTVNFEVGRRVRYTLLSGQFTGSVASSVFGAVTTVVLATDSIPLDATLSAVDYGFLDASNPSVPTNFKSPVSAPSVTSAGTISAVGLATLSSGASLGNVAQVSPTTLDWYEEGGFLPGITFGGAAVGVTYNINRGGNFTRIGNTVNFRLRMRLTSKGSSVGTAFITGLPYAFSASGVIQSTFICACDQMVGLTSMILGAAVASSTNVTLFFQTATTLANLTDANFSNTSDVFVSGQYQVS